jgi:hypothetical protein
MENDLKKIIEEVFKTPESILEYYMIYGDIP